MKTLCKKNAKFNNNLERAKEYAFKNIQYMNSQGMPGSFIVKIKGKDAINEYSDGSIHDNNNYIYVNGVWATIV